MFWNIFLFELRYRLKRPAAYAYFGIFFLLVFGATVSDKIILGEQAGNVFRNAPVVIFRIMTIMSLISILISSAIMSTPILRDFEHKTFQILFAYPMQKSAYLFGRFLGSYVYAIFVMFSIPLAIMFGSWFAPTFGLMDAERFDSFRLIAYLQPFFVVVMINVFFTGVIFFALATLTRKMIWSYLGNVLLIVLYIAAVNKIADMDNKSVASLVDPFGLIAFGTDTQYWTPAELNKNLVPISGLLIVNRLIWLGISMLTLFFVLKKFKFETILGSKKSKTKVKTEENEKVSIETIKFPSFSVDNSLIFQLKTSLSLGILEFKNVLKEIPFLGITAAGVMLLFSNSIGIVTFYGTETYPVTYNILELTSDNFAMFMMIIITFYSGELVWKERQLNISQITDVLPVKNWVFTFSKISAMFFIMIFLQCLVFAASVLIQIMDGFYVFNFPLYFKMLFLIQLPKYFMISILAILIHTLVKDKYAGHGIMILYYVLLYLAFPMLGLTHYLYRYPLFSEPTYSDMNGFGHSLTSANWYIFYWSFFAVLFVILSVLLWNRGTETALKIRWKMALQRITKPVKIAFLFISLGIISSGSWIYYNTSILNKNATADDNEKAAFNYENLYKKYENLTQPTVEAVNVNVDIFPYERKVTAKGVSILKNRKDKPVDTIFMNYIPDVKLNSFSFGKNSKILLEDKKNCVYLVKLEKPLPPNDSITFEYDLVLDYDGFENTMGFSKLVYNGTFLNNTEFLPVLGYSRSSEMRDKHKRKKFGLPPRPRMAKVDDLKARQNCYIDIDGVWIRFECTISTSADQIPIAPGRLVKEWTENNRRFAHYKVEGKMMNFYSFLSSKYEVRRDKWNNVDLEVFYDKQHPYNIEKMIGSMKMSLDYYTKNFTPYSYSNLRIVEFPRYDVFAQSFPTTIPYSEAIGFIANLTDEENIDYTWYVTAHEIAHQWWAEQVIGANVQGATMLSEAFAQYSALMVMEKKYGKEKMRKFLKYELDKYLLGRRREFEKETPLYLVENQSYIHYNKGSIVMYALRDYIGEDSLNHALARFAKDKAYQNAPFTNTLEFLTYLRPVVADSLKYLITDLFETITVFSNQAKEVEYTQLENGKYKVKITVESVKFRADSLGKETEIPVNDYIDIGVFGKEKKNGKKVEKILYLQKHKIDAKKKEFEIIVDSEPTEAGIDPFNKLIDRISDDNRKTATKKK